MNTIHPNAIKLNLNKFVGIFMFLVHVRDCKDTHIYKKGTYKLKKEFVLFTVVMLMAVMAWEKQSGKPVESEFLLDNVEALAAGESGYDTCLGSGNVTCSTGDKVEYVLIPFGLD